MTLFPSSVRSRTLAVALVLALCLVLPVAATTYSVDPVHSSALFKIKHYGASNFYGMFKSVTGTVDYDPANPEASKVAVRIDAATVDTRAENRDTHVKSPDFLDVKQFPTIEFKSKKVMALGGDRFEIVGDLTLHGVTREITAAAEKVGEGKNPRNGKSLIGFEARFTVDRTEFDMAFMAGPLSKEVEFVLSVEAGAE